MKVGAHPLVVAAALGLLGPLALAEDDARRGDAAGTPRVPCAGCTCGAVDQAAEDCADEALLAEAFEALSR